MQGSIKQANTFTTIAAANAEFIAMLATVHIINGSSSRTQIYRGA